MRQIVIIILILIGFGIVFNCCKKPAELKIDYKSYAPIYGYFPCYPGSYWIYEDSLGIQSQVKVEDEYVMGIFETSDDSVNEPIFCPKIDDRLYYGYSNIDQTTGYNAYCDDPYDTLRSFLLFNGHNTWNASNCSAHPAGFTIEHIVFVTAFDSLVINGMVYNNILVNKTYNTYSGYPTGYTPFTVIYTLKYYAQNIGLILQQQINHPDSVPDTVLVKSLVNYKINKK